MRKEAVMQTSDSADGCRIKKSYRVYEIMEILEVSKNTAYKMAHSGAFEIRRVGRSIRIPKASFDEWFDKHHQT